MSALWIAVLLFMAVGIVVSVTQMPRRGPAVRWVPPRWRSAMNDWYRSRGWEEPYDDMGNKRRRS